MSGPKSVVGVESSRLPPRENVPDRFIDDFNEVAARQWNGMARLLFSISVNSEVDVLFVELNF